MIKKYIYRNTEFDDETREFIHKQLKKMPDFYFFGVSILCGFMYLFNIGYKKINILDKLLSSLAIIKLNEKN